MGWKELAESIRKERETGERQTDPEPTMARGAKAGRDLAKRVARSRPTKPVAREWEHPTKGYKIRLFTDGSWHCTCLAWKNNHASPEHRHCKHTRHYEKGGA